MPELPEVETIKNDLKKRMVDKKIDSIEISLESIVKNKKKLFNNSLINKSFTDIRRRGKLLIFTIENGGYLLIHLRMTGQLIYIYNNEFVAGGHEQASLLGDLPNKHTHVRIGFADKSILYYNDLRRFGYLKIVDESQLEGELIKFGPEPLGGDFNFQYLKSKLKNKGVVIKTLLLNQKIIAGIGNIYADEILFDAKVLPKKKSSVLVDGEIKKIVSSTKKIIKKAIVYRGTTFSDYCDSNGEKGNFSQMLRVYGRGGERCVLCKKVLIKEKVNGRGTVYCSSCQG